MILENAFSYKKETSKIFQDYSYLKEIVDLDRPLYIWAEQVGGDIPYRDIGINNPNIKITNIIEKEKLILLVAMFFEIKYCVYETKDLDSEENTTGLYMGNAYFLTDYMFINPPKFDNNFLKKYDFIKRWKILKSFLEENFLDIKDNITWSYIKKLKVEDYEITSLFVYIPFRDIRDIYFSEKNK